MTAALSRSSPASWSEADLRGVIRIQLAAALRCAPDAIDEATPFDAYGLPSLEAVELTAALEDRLGMPVDAEAAFDHGGVAALAAHLFVRLQSEGARA